DRAGKLSGALFDHQLEIALIGAVLHDQATVLQSAPNAEEQLVFLKGLEDVVVSAATDRFEGGLDVVDGGDHNHRNFRVELAHPLKEFDAVHLRHDHVAKDEVRSELLNLFLGSAAVVAGRAAIALGLEHG